MPREREKRLARVSPFNVSRDIWLSSIYGRIQYCASPGDWSRSPARCESSLILLLPPKSPQGLACVIHLVGDCFTSTTAPKINIFGSFHRLLLSSGIKQRSYIHYKGRQRDRSGSHGLFPVCTNCSILGRRRESLTSWDHQPRGVRRLAADRC